MDSFAEASLLYENQAPHECSCIGDHDRWGDDGLNLKTSWCCQCEGCHNDERWWPIRHDLDLVDNQNELIFLSFLYGELDRHSYSVCREAALIAYAETENFRRKDE